MMWVSGTEGGRNLICLYRSEVIVGGEGES